MAVVLGVPNFRILTVLQFYKNWTISLALEYNQVVGTTFYFHA